MTAWIRLTVTFGRVLLRQWAVLAGLCGTIVPTLVAVSALAGSSYTVGDIAPLVAWWCVVTVFCLASILGAHLLSAARQRRMLESLYLSGMTAPRSASAAWGATIVVTLLGAVLTAALATLAIAIAASIGRRGAHHHDIALLVAPTALAMLCAVVAGAGSGISLGIVCPAGSAVAIACSLDAVMTGLSFTSHTAVSILRAVDIISPLGASTRLLDVRAGTLDLLPLVSAAVAVAAFGILLPAIAVSGAKATEHIPEKRPRPARRRTPRTRTGHIVTVATLLVVGVAVPTQLRHLLPWWLSPTWIAQTQEGSTSRDIASAFLDDVRQGRPTAHLLPAAADPRAVLGPYYPYVRHAKRIEVSLPLHDWTRPEDVSVLTSPGLPFDLCLAYRHRTWIVTSARSRSTCPTMAFP